MSVSLVCWPWKANRSIPDCNPGSRTRPPSLSRLAGQTPDSSRCSSVSRTILSLVARPSNNLSSGGAESATAGIHQGLTMRHEGLQKRASGAGARFPAATSLPPRTVQVGSWKVIAWATASACASMWRRKWQIREPASARSSTITSRKQPWF
jgi:hypothetical protein